MFTGFSDATIDFLWELRFHNERPWFLEHKQVFLDTLDRPMKALAADVTAALEQAYPDRKWYLHVARIYRDARRLHGNGPYKENLWFTLRCDSSRGPEIPAFYFEITPHNYSYGMGFYWALPPRDRRRSPAADGTGRAPERAGYLRAHRAGLRPREGRPRRAAAPVVQ